MFLLQNLEKQQLRGKQVITNKEINELIIDLEKIADEDCICSSKQETGEDPTVCRRCEAAGILNRVGELLRDEMKEL